MTKKMFFINFQKSGNEQTGIPHVTTQHWTHRVTGDCENNARRRKMRNQLLHGLPYGVGGYSSFRRRFGPRPS